VPIKIIHELVSYNLGWICNRNTINGEHTMEIASNRDSKCLLSLALVLALMLINAGSGWAWTLDDIPPTVKPIKSVRYVGSAIETYTFSKSCLTDDFEGETDTVYKQEYSFTGVRVWFPGAKFSFLYPKTQRGKFSFEHEEYGENRNSKAWHKETASCSDSGSVVMPEPLRMGVIKADGEARWFLPTGVAEFLPYKKCTHITTYSDGKVETRELSSGGFTGIQIGGGKDEACQPDRNDRSLAHTGSCKVYLKADGSSSGHFKDIIHRNVQGCIRNAIKTIEWTLTPVDSIE
jgi:hypothetical protein